MAVIRHNSPVKEGGRKWRTGHASRILKDISPYRVLFSLD